MPNKKRVLICNDAHFLHTGFAKYGKEVLTRLAKTGKYELAELACYGFIDSPSSFEVPWKYYANAVKPAHKYFKDYRGHGPNEFGEWRFDRTVLDFKCDAVLDYRDPYYSQFIYNSPLRDFYHLSLMPTVDSIPQKTSWIEDFRQADSVLVYSEWAKPVLEENRIKVSGIASPGIDLNTYKQQKKDSVRAKLGLPQDSFIVGTIMRNQARKLYPELFQAFAKFLSQTTPEIAAKTYLYVHSGYPDASWSFPELLLEHGIAHKVYFTYVCPSCKHYFSSLYRDTKTICKKCGKRDSVLANTDTGLKDEELCEVLNTFDLYIQYSVAEGFGMPQVEAAACGVPITAVNYSAMADIVKNTYGMPIEYTLFRDAATNAYRALPNIENTCYNMHIFFAAPQSFRDEIGQRARLGVEKHYTWDICAKTWEDHLDSIELTGKQGKYNLPYQQTKVYQGNMPEIKNDGNFVDWAIVNVADSRKLLNSHLVNRLKADLYLGYRKVGKDNYVVDRKYILNQCVKIAQVKEQAELARCGMIKLEEEDFLLRANMKS